MKKYQKNRINPDGTLIVYSFDSIFFEYKGVDSASPSPREIGVYHLPACTTDIKPPRCNKNNVLKFENNKWIKIPLKKSSIYYLRALELRRERDLLLFQSDWTQALDAPQNIDRKKWRIYRQLLRDIPQQKDFPMIYSFPPKP